MNKCICGYVNVDLSNRLQFRQEEVAEVLGVSLSKVKEWVRTDVIPSYKMDNIRCVAREDVVAFIAKSRQLGNFGTAV